MRIVMHGHSCFEFSASGTIIVIDPHDGKSIGIKPPSVYANYVLMTHSHYDHSAARVVQGKHKDYMAVNGEFELGDVRVEGIPTYHDHNKGEDRGPNTMYTFTMDGISICHCGDLGCMPPDDVIERLHGVDLMFVPVGEVFTMPLDEVKQLIMRVNPNIVVPMHYRIGGLSLPLSPLDEFLDMIPDEAVVYMGSEIELTRDDLPDVKECWVFQR